MIEHIGMLKFKSFTTKSQKDILISKLQNLGELIPSLTEIKAGYNFSGKIRGSILAYQPGLKIEMILKIF